MCQCLSRSQHFDRSNFADIIMQDKMKSSNRLPAKRVFYRYQYENCNTHGGRALSKGVRRAGAITACTGSRVSGHFYNGDVIGRGNSHGYSFLNESIGLYRIRIFRAYITQKDETLRPFWSFIRVCIEDFVLSLTVIIIMLRYVNKRGHPMHIPPPPLLDR